MNGFFKLGLQASPNHLKQASKMLSFLFCFLLFSKLWAQEVQFFKCTESTPTFTGIPEPTLCEEYPNFSCEIQIGLGTQYPKSSLLGASVTGNVCVIGNFEVDATFTFIDATVKITPGVTIVIAPSPNGYDVGGWLGINNSKLFACNGLWKGITVGQLSSISTWNNTVIEDAETAISASGLCALFIQQTTFNRDRVGIFLNTPFPNIFVPGPLMWTFSGNHFNCDAPLNGTVDEITTAGIKLKDSFLGTFQSLTNTFTDIQYGIYSEGSSSYIGCQNLHFQRIRRDGIFMDKGNMDLRSCRFLNCYGKSVHIESANNVSISGSYFRWDDNLPLLVSDLNLYYGVHVEEFAFASNTQISKNFFSADLTSGQKRVIGVWHQGSDIGGGTAIGMNQNTFHFYGGPAIGILLDGDFPSESQIDIYDNDFDIQDQLNAGNPTCIWSSGNKYDFDIIGNRFYNSLPKNGWATGMILQGSEGTGNEVSDNHFEQGLYLDSYLCGFQVQSFKNTKFCANTSLNARRMFCFYGQNEGTDFTGNIAYGSQLIFMGDQSWVEDQSQKGNQWTAEYQGFVFPVIATPQAECTSPDYAEFSEFRVHTPQSIFHAGPVGFNPFHPRDISPDDTDQWWSQENGTPVGTCIYEIVGPGDVDTKLRRAVADGSLAAQFSDPSMIWQAQRTLYFTLKQDTSLETLYPAYSSFKSAKGGGNIDKLYQVANALNAARNGNSQLQSNAQNNRVSIDDMLIQIEAADQAWQKATKAADQKAAQKDKQQKIGELMALLQNAANFQTVYKQNLLNELAGVQQTNNSITNTNEWEGHEKNVNSIFISYLQNGILTKIQQADLETFAGLCPKSEGMVVYKARSMLPECIRLVDRDNQKDCYPAPELLMPAEPRSAESRSTEQPSLQTVERASVFPTLALETVTVSVPNGKQGSIRLLNTFGSLVSEQQIVSPQTSFGLAMLPPGIYYLNILYSDGQRESLKFIVSK